MSEYHSPSLERFQANCAVANTSELAAGGEIPSLSSFLEAFDLEARLFESIVLLSELHLDALYTFVLLSSSCIKPVGNA